MSIQHLCRIRVQTKEPRLITEPNERFRANKSLRGEKKHIHHSIYKESIVVIWGKSEPWRTVQLLTLNTIRYDYILCIYIYICTILTRLNLKVNHDLYFAPSTKWLVLNPDLGKMVILAAHDCSSRFAQPSQRWYSTLEARRKPSYFAVC